MKIDDSKIINVVSNERSENKYRLVSFVIDRKIRFMIRANNTSLPIVAISLYESYLYSNCVSPNSIRFELNNLCFLFTWSESLNIDANIILLQGKNLNIRDIRLFRAWLSNKKYSIKYKDKKNSCISSDYINSIIGSSSRLFKWFSEQYGTYSSTSERDLGINRLVEDWRSVIIKNKKKRAAQDLEDDEIIKIDQYLKVDEINKFDIDAANAIRNYLMWRMAIEFGLRIGEILSLRICDMPNRDRDALRIIRVDERGDDYYDPRGKYAPRVKTLSRELGFVIKNSPIKKLINMYMSRSRRMYKKNISKKLYFVRHDFLFINHNDGEPLSVSAAEDVAKKIRNDTGVENFHWHIARHAFFNRAYSSIIGYEDFESKKIDLITYGGWQSEKSIEIYIQRTLNIRARTTIETWQTEAIWSALES